MNALVQTVTLLNRRPTLLHLPPVFDAAPDSEGNPRPELHRSTPLSPGSVKAPVATVIPADVWERTRRHRAVKQWLALGWVSEKPADVVAPSEAPPPDNLLGYGISAAVLMVEQEADFDTLRMWQQAEGRQPVKDALAKRIAALPGGKKR